jgi:hypothetical protein
MNPRGHYGRTWIGDAPRDPPKGDTGMGLILVGITVAAVAVGLVAKRIEGVEVEKHEKSKWRNAGLLQEMESWRARHGVSSLSQRAQEHFDELLRRRSRAA